MLTKDIVSFEQLGPDFSALWLPFATPIDIYKCLYTWMIVM